MANYIRKFEIGGLHVDSNVNATTYVGDLNDIWADDSNLSVLRRGDGVTPGGIVMTAGVGSSGITLSDLSVTPAAPSGLGTLTYNNANGNFTYTPPVVPQVLTDFGIADGTSGQFLKTDGAGNFSFDDPNATGIALTDLSVSVNPAGGGGNLVYDNVTGNFAYTPPDLSSFSTLANLVEDTTPELGGELDANGNGVVNINTLQLTPISSAPTATEGTLAIDDGTNWSGVANQESLVIYLNGAWRAILTTGV